MKDIAYDKAEEYYLVMEDEYIGNVYGKVAFSIDLVKRIQEMIRKDLSKIVIEALESNRGKAFTLAFPLFFYYKALINII